MGKNVLGSSGSRVSLILVIASYWYIIIDAKRDTYFLMSFSMTSAVDEASSLGLMTTQFPEAMAPVTGCKDN